MNLERAAMKGKLAELQATERRLKYKIDGTASAIRAGLNTTIRPIEELEVPQLAEQMDALVSDWAELLKILADIARLEKELR